ncbi:PREDICTED: putative gustatory receptor 28b [Vollenhovia emeryi]|uniref:putative gustatory receptor 28b n=1 Tax=Vollenhovia emeryi TaxID=411798 RepID=UPI0005F4C207|nr:PREDICTED: putative gustatory receptor 28b [Vollenhovia emeryi]
MEHYIEIQIFEMNMLYVNCVCILKACFKRIDDNLTNLRELMINDKSHLPRLIYHQQRNPLLLKELKTLEKQYLMVSDTVQMLNKIFSPQLLATIATTFIEITFELYVNIVEWKHGLSINLSKQIYDTIIMTYTLYLIIRIIIIVWACETSKNQATKINTTVHEVLNSTSNEQIKNELQLFSLQILHRDNTFSTKCFIVNAPLLSTMVGIITTYLLILIQFLASSHSCDEETAANVMQSN